MMGFFKKGELKLLWPFYFDALFLTMLFLCPIFYVLYFRELGFSLAQIGFLASAYSLGMILFEIPTGAIADLWGRKISTILGYFLAGIAVIAVIFTGNFYAVMALSFARGAFGTLRSGAEDAWVVDLLKHKKRKELIHEFYSKQQSFISAGFLVAGIIGAFLVKIFGLWIIWPVTGTLMIATSIVFLFGQEHFVKGKRIQGVIQRVKAVFGHSMKSINYSMKHNVISLLIFSGMICMIVTAFAYDLTWFPFLQNLGFKAHWFGYLMSASCFLGIFIPYFTKSLSIKLGGYKRYLIFILSLQIFLLLSVLFVKWMLVAVLVYLLFLISFDFYGPVRVAFYQHFLPSKMRATIDSFRSMLYSIVTMITAPLAGFIADKIGPQITIAIGGILLIPAIFLYLKIKGDVVPK